MSTRPGLSRRKRWGALTLAVVGSLLAFGALAPAGTSAAWQDTVYFATDVEILPSLIPAELDAGAGFTCALVGGDMWCWGEGGSGQLGVGSTADADVPVSASATSMVVGTGVHVTAGVGYACGAAGGRAYCWGEGGGKLGNYQVDAPWDVPSTSSPTPVYDLPAGGGNQYESPLYGQTIREVVAGEYITCAETIEGTAACWGLIVGLTRPVEGPTSWPNAPIPLPTSAQDPLSQLPPGAEITSLTTTFKNACFIADGTGYCWGANEQGQLGIDTAGDARPAPVELNPGDMPLDATVTDMSAGKFHTCAVADGSAYCWGLRGDDAIGDNEGQSLSQNSPSAVVGLDSVTIVEISAGDNFTCALDDAGQAWCWGTNSTGQLGTSEVPLAGKTPVPVQVTQPDGVVFRTISSGAGHVCAIATDDNIYCWGAAGTLGTGAGQVNALVPSVAVTPMWESVEE
jgi:alpha-tubulin suppressor-like RCC1 family protein